MDLWVAELGHPRREWGAEVMGTFMAGFEVWVEFPWPGYSRV